MATEHRLVFEAPEDMKQLVIAAWPLSQNPTVKSYFVDKVRQLKELTWCEHCEAHYTLWDTVGKHLCKSHPSPLVEDRVSGQQVWACCRQRPEVPGRISGCRQADHLIVSEQAVEHHATFELPLLVWTMLPHALARSTSLRAIIHDPLYGQDQRDESHHQQDQDALIQRLFRTADEIQMGANGHNTRRPSPELTLVHMDDADLDLFYCQVFVSRIES